MIDLALMKHVWRDIRHRDIRLLIIAVFFMTTIGGTCGALCSWPDGAARVLTAIIPAAEGYLPLWVCVLGAGVVGIKVSRGTLALILSRPVSTTTFVISTWLAVAIAVIVVQALYMALQAAQILIFLPSSFDLGTFVVVALKSLCVCLAASAVLVFFSTLLNGVKDSGLFFLVWFASIFLQQTKSFPVRSIEQTFLRHLAQAAVSVAERLGDIGMACVSPAVPFSTSVLFSWNLVLSLVALAAVVLASLSLAVFRLNKMELSYGAD